MGLGGPSRSGFQLIERLYVGPSPIDQVGPIQCSSLKYLALNVGLMGEVGVGASRQLWLVPEARYHLAQCCSFCPFVLEAWILTFLVLWLWSAFSRSFSEQSVQSVQ
jgi:hypothetical protein